MISGRGAITAFHKALVDDPVSEKASRELSDGLSMLISRIEWIGEPNVLRRRLVRHQGLRRLQAGPVMIDPGDAAVIERNLGPQPPRPAWGPTAGEGAPPELAAYLDARRRFIRGDGGNEVVTALLDAHRAMLDLIRESGPVSHAGHRYEARGDAIAIVQE